MDELDDGVAPKKGGLSRGCIIAIVLSLVLSFGGVTACVLGGMWLANIGMEMLAEQISFEIEDNPVILEHVGTIQEIEVDFSASAVETGEDVLVFNIVGSKSEAVLTVETITVDGDSENVTWGRIVLPSGESYSLFPDQGEKPR